MEFCFWMDLELRWFWMLAISLEVGWFACFCLFIWILILLINSSQYWTIRVLFKPAEPLLLLPVFQEVVEVVALYFLLRLQRVHLVVHRQLRRSYLDRLVILILMVPHKRVHFLQVLEIALTVADLIDFLNQQFGFARKYAFSQSLKQMLEIQLRVDDDVPQFLFVIFLSKT